MITLVLATLYPRTFAWMQEVFADEPGIELQLTSAKAFINRPDLDALVESHPTAIEFFAVGLLPYHRHAKVSDALIVSSQSARVSYTAPWIIVEPYYQTHPIDLDEAMYLIMQQILAAVEEWNASAPAKQYIRRVGYLLHFWQISEPDPTTEQKWKGQFASILQAFREYKQQ